MDAETRKNRDYANVAPGTYEIHLKDKKEEPKWSMGAKLKEVNRNFSPSP